MTTATTSFENNSAAALTRREETCTAIQRRRPANPIHLPSMFWLLVVAGLCGVIGVVYVGIKIKGVANETAIAHLERQIQEKREDNRILEKRIEYYTSRPYLQERLAAGDLPGLQPIRRDALVQMPVATARETLVSNDVDYRLNPDLQGP